MAVSPGNLYSGQYVSSLSVKYPENDPEAMEFRHTNKPGYSPFLSENLFFRPLPNH